MSPTSFADLPVREFLALLASDTPTPGGGTGAAMSGATGAALARMVATLTVGRPKFAAVEPLMKAVAESAKETCEALLALADEDARSYDAVGAAYKLPKDTAEQQAARKQAIQAALKGACRVPMKVMERCLEVIGLAKTVVLQGNPNAASDGAAGAEFARAGLAVAAYNVRINLVAIEDEAFCKDMRTRLDEMLYMGSTVANEVDSKVQDLWKPRRPAGSLPVVPSAPPKKPS